MSINNKFSATIVPITASRDSNNFQHDLSLIQSNICKRFQTNDFDNYLLDELSS